MRPGEGRGSPGEAEPAATLPPLGDAAAGGGGGAPGRVAAASGKRREAAAITPRGRPKSGRVWKDPRRKRFSHMIQDKPLHSSWERKMKERQEKKAVKDFARHLEEQKQRQREEKKQRREENLRRRLENERKAEIVQVIRNPLKLKRAKKKQLRRIEKRDTLSLLQKHQKLATFQGSARQDSSMNSQERQEFLEEDQVAAAMASALHTHPIPVQVHSVQQSNEIEVILDEDPTPSARLQPLTAMVCRPPPEEPGKDAVSGTSRATPQRQGGSKLQKRPSPASGQRAGPNPKKRKADTSKTNEDRSEPDVLGSNEGRTNRQREFCTFVYESVARLKKRERMLEEERKALQAESEQLYNLIDQYACEIIKSYNKYPCGADHTIQGGGILPEHGSEANESSESSFNTDRVGGGYTPRLLSSLAQWFSDRVATAFSGKKQCP